MSSHNRAQNSVHSPVAVPANIITQCVLPCATRTDGPSEDLQIGEHLTHIQEEFGDGLRGLLCRATPAVNKLTDDSLLDIFDVYLDGISPRELGSIDRWHTLVHVCRRWRDLVFASPRRLNLRLLCNRRRSARIMLDIWPPLLIMIKNYWTITRELGLDNINTFTALEHPDRVSSIDLDNLPGSIVGTLVSEMRVPFPELTYLRLWSENRSTPDLPDSFLGGSAPRLQTLKLCDISFPALPKLFLSASDLVDLTLRGVPHSGYISPEAMVACLSALSRLKSLSFGFQSRLSRPNQPSPPPETHFVLPALTDLTFQGMAHYLDDFLARIDTPVLNKFSMSLIVGLVSDVPHLTRFVDRAKGLKPYKVTRVVVTTSSIQFSLTEPPPLSL